MIIGICGKSGSGKSTLAKMLSEKKNGIHINIDTIGHDVLLIKEVQLELVACFGESIISKEHVDRKKLGELVFCSRDKMKKLSDITWRYMEMLLDKILIESKDKVVILDWILLPKTKYFGMCDETILLDIPYEIRKERAINRDDITADQFALRERASIEYNKERFDLVVNCLTLEEMKGMVKTI